MPDKPTLKELSDRFWELRARKKALTAELKEIDAALDELKYLIIQETTAMGLHSLSTAQGTLTPGEKEVVQIDDFDAFWEYVRENDAPYFFQRRPAVTAIKQALDMGEEVPGVKLKTVKNLSISVRKSNDEEK